MRLSTTYHEAAEKGVGMEGLAPAGKAGWGELRDRGPPVLGRAAPSGFSREAVRSPGGRVSTNSSHETNPVQRLMMRGRLLWAGAERPGRAAAWLPSSC